VVLVPVLAQVARKWRDLKKKLRHPKGGATGTNNSTIKVGGGLGFRPPPLPIPVSAPAN